MLTADLLSSEQQRELDEFYWHTDTTVAELHEYFDLPKGRVHEFVSPLEVDSECPNCGGHLSFSSRAARIENKKVCPSCEHRQSTYCEERGYSVVCKCSHCREHQQHAREAQEVQQLEARQQALEEWELQKCTEDYAVWAISKLDRRTRLVFRAVIDQLARHDQEFSWAEVEDSAGVVARHTYVDRLLSIGLAHPRPDGGLVFNGCLAPDEIAIETVRSISSSLRFETFQRDQHTCQYCGRRPPEVELEVDHLIPVAKNGTDDPENLVTSCKDCNRGKSAKLIAGLPGNKTIEDRRTEIREQRLSELDARRENLALVLDHWKSRRGYLSSYDEKAIHSLIERYDADSIIRALDIAIDKKPTNYVKYVSGILRNWARSGTGAG
jgi:DnaD/phage-associated family protein